jgi:sugar phosphate permease
VLGINRSASPALLRSIVFGLACLASWTLYLHRYAWGYVKGAVQQQFGLSTSDLGWLDSAFMATYSLGQLPSGWAADRWGPRRIVTVIMLAWSLALTGIGIATGFGTLLLGRLLFGAAQAGTYPSLGLLTRSWFPPARRTLVQGAIASLAGRMGGACAGLLVATWLMSTCGLDWRAALLTISAGGFCLALVWWIVIRDAPEVHPWWPTQAAQAIPSDAEATSSSSRLRIDTRSLITLGSLLTTIFLATFADNFFANWLPPYLLQEKGLDLRQTGLLGGLPLWTGAFGGLCGGWLNDFLAQRTGSRRWSRTGVALCGQLLAAGLVASSLLVQSGVGAVLLLASAKFFIDWGQPTVWGTITDIGGNAAARMFGLVNMVGTAGALAAGPSMGYLIESSGFAPLLMLVAAIYVLAALLWLGVDCSRTLVVERPDSD